VAVRRAAGLLTGQGSEPPETFWYSVKRRMLGPPLITEQLIQERLSKPLALGVLSCDGISSANYGSELILYELLPFFGLASFTLLLPLTGVVLLGIFLVVLSYREVVSVYTRAGGSYVVARENFGPRVAQIAAVALMVDYVVTVAVQNSAGSAAILSTFPALAKPLGDTATLLLITVAATLLMCYVNLLGVRENGRTFALPTYLFSASVGLMIIVGLAHEFFGGGLGHVTWHTGTVPIGHTANGLITFAAILILARAFANGGSSLTGIEAVSNAVSALRPPEGRNARQILVAQGSIVMFLIAGISWLAHVTHAVPYVSGVPTVVSQEADLVFGNSIAGRILFYLVQAGAITILFTGGNTSFSGFPFLTSFVAEDSFLPRWLSKRGHRLVFSNGIIVLTILALALLFAVGASTAKLVALYAIGVFTGFSMAGFGMVRYHLRQREPGWRRKLVINLTGGIYTALVVLIFAVVKFREGAWLVVVVFPIGVFAFIRLNRQYRGEARALENIGERRAAGGGPRQPNYTRRVVIVFVDDFDLSTVAALRYAKSLRPTVVRAVHFVIDSEQAERLRAAWLPDRSVSLEFIDCPDRRLTRCAADLVSHEAKPQGTQVTAILPRRSFSPLLGRLLHDRTADKIAGVVSRVPNAAATIIPFDVQNRLHVLQERQAGRGGKAPASLTPVPGPPRDGEQQDGEQQDGEQQDGEQQDGEQRHPKAAAAAALPAAAATQAEAKPEPLPGAGGYDRPIPPSGCTPIGALTIPGHQPGKVCVEGRVRVVEIRPVERNSVLACEISDSTGDLTALFYGRSRIAGLMCGSRVRFRGPVGIKGGAPVMVNPAYELIVPHVTSGPGQGD
jgi:amino acid transporter